MSKTIRQIAAGHSDLWLAVAAVAGILVWRGWVVAHRPAHAREIADEISAVWHHPGDLHPNHANTYIVFDQPTESGVGLFFSSVSGGTKKLICQQAEQSWSWQLFGGLGWSPDDGWFACALPPNDPKQPAEEIIIVNGVTGEGVVKLKASQLLGDFAWLTPNSFAEVSWDGDSHDLTVVEQVREGDWEEKSVIKKIGGKNMTALTATSAQSVAWREGDSLWSLDLAAPTPEKIWEATPTNKLVDFTYSQADKEFALNCSDATGQYLLRFYPPTHWLGDGGRIKGPGPDPIPGVTWYQKAPHYAYCGQSEGMNALYIKHNTNSELTRLPWPGDIYKFTLNGDTLYISGDTTNLPPGVWAYNLNSADLYFVGTALDCPLKYAGLAAPASGMITNAAGRVKLYHLWGPAVVSAGKKYPLIINQSTLGGPYPHIAASMGYYFATVHRPGWFEGLDSWGEDVQGLYNILAQKPDIDPHRVFLSGSSSETVALCQLLTEKPDQWAGAFLLSPSVLPDLDAVHLTSLFVVAGANDGDAIKRLTAFQNRATDEGIFVKLVFLSGAGHITRSLNSEREQLEQGAAFLSEN